MSVDYLKKPLFRMVHFDNLEYLLRNGMCKRNHQLADPDYINIGDSELIQQRQEYPVQIPPGGNLGDYVPFYFAGHSPMLYNIKTGYRGIRQRSQAEIVFLLCSIGGVVNLCPEWCFTDGHAKNTITEFYNKLVDLDKIDWATVQMRIWKNTDADWDRQRKKQAEFLVKNHVPVECIAGIIVLTPERKEKAEKLVQKLGLNIPVKVDVNRKLYYP